MPCTHASSSARPKARRARVLLPLPLDTPFDYRVPSGGEIVPGHVVRVPFGSGERVGVAWDVAEGADDIEVADDRLKDVAEVLDVVPLDGAIRAFVDWVAAYYLVPRGRILRMVLSVPEALHPPRPTFGYGAGETAGLRLTAARERVLRAVAGGPVLSAAELAAAAGVGIGVVQGLAAAGALSRVALPAPAGFAAPDPSRPGPALSPEQAAATGALAARVAAGAFSVSVLDGVTGAGKTEVYFEAIAAALLRGQQVLVLLPEIALTAQWLGRFEARFGVQPAVWHSELGAARRRATWRAAASGAAALLVGARSALFLPLPRLGLIVVDEEHDASFKQEDGVMYNARDMAVVRARFAARPVVLVSATPSLETVANVESGRYQRLHLPKRHGGAQLPRIVAVDMRLERLPGDRWLSQALVDALIGARAAGTQAMLFLNRRGYAPLTLCRACGHRLQCPNCSAWLVEHRLSRRLQCHHCGFSRALPDACPECHAEGRLVACGPGVERLAEEAATLFPDARIAVMASDTLAGPKEAAAMIEAMTRGEIDLLIGTQIIAKGHHFPNLAVVGVVDADLGLGGGDLRAAERTYQMLAQVAGRAGRESHLGTVYLQTYMPEHPVMQALVAGERDAFVRRETAERRAHGMPPFGRLAAVILSGRSEPVVARSARALARAAPTAPGIRVLGPAPAPLALLRGDYRYRLLLKAERGVALQSVLREWLAAAPPLSGVRLQMDIDPYSFL
ncbi:MAG: primosomal protein N' [Alphaproteobacteria bacterium]|nr:primosomal protein N' [Alphaproteobacteria bacterium]